MEHEAEAVTDAGVEYGILVGVCIGVVGGVLVGFAAGAATTFARIVREDPPAQPVAEVGVIAIGRRHTPRPEVRRG